MAVCNGGAIGKFSVPLDSIPACAKSVALLADDLGVPMVDTSTWSTAFSNRSSLSFRELPALERSKALRPASSTVRDDFELSDEKDATAVDVLRQRIFLL